VYRAMQLPNSHQSIGVRNSSPMMARMGRQRRMAGSRLDGGDGGDGGTDAAPAGACPWAAGRRRGRKRDGGGGARSLGGKASGGMYGRRSGTGSAVVSGGCRHAPDCGGCRHPPGSRRCRHAPDSGDCRRAAGMSRRRRIIGRTSLSGRSRSGGRPPDNTGKLRLPIPQAKQLKPKDAAYFAICKQI